MYTVYEISDDRKGQLAIVTDQLLADRISTGVAGSLSRGLGNIKELDVFESFEDLPENIQEVVLKHEANDAIKKRREIESYLGSLSETERAQAIEFLNKIL
jgi:hypothetical protein